MKLPTRVVEELQHLAVQHRTSVDVQASKALRELLVVNSDPVKNTEVSYACLEQLWLTMPRSLDVMIAKKAHGMGLAPARLILELLTKRFMKEAQPV